MKHRIWIKTQKNKKKQHNANDGSLLFTAKQHQRKKYMQHLTMCKSQFLIYGNWVQRYIEGYKEHWIEILFKKRKKKENEVIFK